MQQHIDHLNQLLMLGTVTQAQIDVAANNLQAIQATLDAAQAAHKNTRMTLEARADEQDQHNAYSQSHRNARHPLKQINHFPTAHSTNLATVLAH